MRVFVALELPREVRASLVRWCPRHDALRPVAVESLHVTLAFLGERSEHEAAAVGGLLEGVARPLRALALGDARWLPQRRPRVLSVEVCDGDGALGALQSELVARLGEAIGFVAERRAFLPHVTVARVRGPLGGLGRSQLSAPPGAGSRFAAEAVTLMRSRLGRGGARYEPLQRVAL